MCTSFLPSNPIINQNYYYYLSDFPNEFTLNTLNNLNLDNSLAVSKGAANLSPNESIIDSHLPGRMHIVSRLSRILASVPLSPSQITFNLTPRRRHHSYHLSPVA